METRKKCSLQLFCLILISLFALEIYASSRIVSDIIYESFDESFEESWVASKTKDYLGEKANAGGAVRLEWEARFYRLFHCRTFGRVEVGFPRIWESQKTDGGRIVDLGHSARCHAKPKDIQKMESNETPKKPRFLCLHGHGSNATLLEDHFKNWPNFVLEKMDFVYINGPFSVADGLFEWYTTDKLISLGSDGKMDPDFCDCWLVTATNYFYLLRNSFFKDYKTENFDEGIAYIEDRMVELGPFDGVLGFSQGAFVAGALPGMQAQGVCLTKVGKVEHAIIISGGKLGGTFPSPKLAENAYSSPINIPSLHIWGETDVVRLSAPKLVEAYVDPLVYVHPGGHEVPKLDEDGLKIMFEFLKKINAIV